MEQTEMFQNFFEAKSNKLSCSKYFQKQRGTNQGISKFSEAKRNKKKNSKAFLEQREANGFVPKICRLKEKNWLVKKQQKIGEKQRFIFLLERRQD